MDAIRTGSEGQADAPDAVPRPRRPARYPTVVAEELAHQIIGGTAPAGAVLPAEPALGDRFGFSRTVIREALKLLEERGLVRVEQGRGTTVRSRDAWNLLDPLVIRIALTYDDDMALLDNLITVRRVLEREMARAAATRLTDEDLAALEANLAQMEASYDDYERFRAFDLSFHAVVMRASGNDVGQAIVHTIHTHAGMMRPIASAQSRAELERTATEHRAIFEALSARDGEAAGERVAAHIDFAWADRKRRHELDSG
jgi:DNA-binding FadR family transcriptional regulator